MKSVKSNWAEPSTTSENEVLPKWFKWLWSLRGLSVGLNSVIMLQITYYCTDMLGLSAVLVGAMLMGSKILDAFTDIFAGYLIDNTHSKWGKGRPYDIAVVFMWLITVLLFSAPNFGTVGKAIYVFIMYSLVNSVFGTLCMVADPVYLTNSVRSDKNKMSVTSFQGAIIMLGATIAGIIAPILVGSIGMQKSGWTIIALIFAVPSAIIGSIRIFFIKEVRLNSKDIQDKPKIGIKQGLKALFSNCFALLICLLVILNNAQSTIATAAATYYFKWIFGNVSLASIISLATIITPFILIFVPMLSRKTGNGALLKVGFAIMSLGYLIRLFAGPNLLLILVSSVFTAIGTIPIATLASIYAYDCMDYGEWKTGTRIEGMIASSSSFAYKLGGGIGSGLLGIFMSVSGYISSNDAVTQTDSAIKMIKFSFAGLPLILSILAFVLSLFYTLDKKKPEIQAWKSAKG